MTAVLSVNLNKIALIRNARFSASAQKCGGVRPDLREMAKTALEAGASGITLHPRSDMRHVRPEDVQAMALFLGEGVFQGAELNLEGNPFAMANGDFPGYMELARLPGVHQCTLVPDTPDQLTSDAGWELSGNQSALREVISELQAQGRRVSLFIDPEPRWALAAAELGADRVELFTGPWASACQRAWAEVSADAQAEAEALLLTYQKAAQTAVDAGLGVNAGHDLNLNNLDSIARLPGLKEVSIGHELTIDALRMGLSEAVKSYLEILRTAPGEPQPSLQLLR